MITDCEPWLPPAADGEVERAVAVFLTPWARDWLPGAEAVRVRGHSARVTDDLCWSGPAGSAVGVTPGARIKFGLALIDGQADPENLADRELLDRLADAALSDLASRFEGDASIPEDPRPGSRVILRLSVGEEGWHMLLALGSRTRIAIRRAAAGHGPAPALATLREALAPEWVAVGCHIGRAMLSAGEVAGLAAGDLITFDRRLSDDLPLTVACQIAASGKAKIVDDGEGPAVRIIQAVELQHT